MSNEWLELAWINYVKAILHGQMFVDGREVTIEQVLTDEQKQAVHSLISKQEYAMSKLLRSFVNDYSRLPEHHEL